MTAVGFEPTHPKIVELKSTALDHSAKLSVQHFDFCVWASASQLSDLQPPASHSSASFRARFALAHLDLEFFRLARHFDCDNPFIFNMPPLSVSSVCPSERLRSSRRFRFAIFLCVIICSCSTHCARAKKMRNRRQGRVTC